MFDRLKKWLLRDEIKQVEEAEAYHKRMGHAFHVQHEAMVRHAWQAKGLVDSLAAVLDGVRHGELDRFMRQLVGEIPIADPVAFASDPSPFDRQQVVTVAVPETRLSHVYPEDADRQQAVVSKLMNAVRFIHYLKATEHKS